MIRKIVWHLYLETDEATGRRKLVWDRNNTRRFQEPFDRLTVEDK